MLAAILSPMPSVSPPVVADHQAERAQNNEVECNWNKISQIALLVIGVFALVATSGLVAGAITFRVVPLGMFAILCSAAICTSLIACACFIGFIAIRNSSKIEQISNKYEELTEASNRHRSHRKKHWEYIENSFRRIKDLEAQVEVLQHSKARLEGNVAEIRGQISILSPRIQPRTLRGVAAAAAHGSFH